MKMVAAAKLRRAQEAIAEARPYALLLEQSLARVASRAARRRGRRAPAARVAAGEARSSWWSSPPTAAWPAASTPTSSGAPSASWSRTPTSYERDRRSPPSAARGGTACGPARWRCARTTPASTPKLELREGPRDRRASSSERFLAGEVDAVFLLYNEFKSAIAQVVTLKQFLPVETGPAEATAVGGLPLRAPPRRSCSPTSSRATSTCRCGGRCSSRPPASTARA